MKITVTDVQVAGFSDAGNLFKIDCPECGSTISLTDGFPWWSTECSCGYDWDEATGTKSDP